MHSLLNYICLHRHHYILTILPISYTNSIKYLGYTTCIFSSDYTDDAEMLRQMRLLYCRSNRLIRMFNKCSQNVLVELCRSFCTTFYIVLSLLYWTQNKKLHFLSFELHTIMCIVKCLVSSDEAVPAKYL